MNIAVVFAGGVGSRMHSKELPKQFLVVHGKPVIVRTIELFQNHPDIDAVVVACLQEWIDYCAELAERFSLTKVARIVPGGKTGQLSIYAGLTAAKALAGDTPCTVLIHDGVRPVLDNETIGACIASVRRFGSAVTCARATETVVEADENGFVSVVHPREALYLARAPQAFWLDDLMELHRRALEEGRDNFIDSASMMMHYGHTLHVVVGPAENLKVTTPGDFFALRALLDARENEQIYGVETVR